MANLGGPKGPSDPAKGGTLLQFPKGPPGAEEVPVARRVDPPAVHEAQQRPGAPSGFEPGTGHKAVIPEANDGPGGGVAARLVAMGLAVPGRNAFKTATTDAGGFKETPIGRIFDGSLEIETVSGLRRLENVVRVSGDLTLHESNFKSADLLVLRSLAEVGGRLTIEGNNLLGILDALESLERARGIYVGFCPALVRARFAKLKDVGAAVIFEHCPALREISLPALAVAGRYVHVHECAALASFSAPALARVAEELSFLDNGKLTQLRVGSRDKPAVVPVVALARNGLGTFPQLFTSSTPPT